jgi:hypothetical protein
MEYKVKALKVSSINGYIVTLEEYSLPEKYTTYRVHLHIPGIKQIFKDSPTVAVQAADKYSHFNDDYRKVLDTYADWVTEINKIDIDSDTIAALEYPKYLNPKKDYIVDEYSLLRNTIEYNIQITVAHVVDFDEYKYSGTLKIANCGEYDFYFEYIDDTCTFGGIHGLLNSYATLLLKDKDGKYVVWRKIFEDCGFKDPDRFSSALEDIFNDAIGKFNEERKK